MGISARSQPNLTIGMQLTPGEIRNEVAASQNIYRVDKTKGIVHIHGNEV